jgi:hypothetical protein
MMLSATFALLVDVTLAAIDDQYYHTPTFDASIDFLTTTIGIASVLALGDIPLALTLGVGVAGGWGLIEIVRGRDKYTACEKFTAFTQLVFGLLVAGVWYGLSKLFSGAAPIIVEYALLAMFQLLNFGMLYMYQADLVAETKKPWSARMEKCQRLF